MLRRLVPLRGLINSKKLAKAFHFFDIAGWIFWHVDFDIGTCIRA